MLPTRECPEHRRLVERGDSAALDTHINSCPACRRAVKQPPPTADDPVLEPLRRVVVLGDGPADDLP